MIPLVGFADSVGVTSAVNPDTFGTPPEADTRTLYLGDEVFFEELIETGPAGRAQVMLLDQSAFSVGPNSSMVLDEFVYDPDTSAGELTATISEGVFRFVGGALSKNEDAVTFNTPNATIGVRGGIVTIEIDPETGDQIITLVYGEVLVTDSAGNTRRLVEPGYQVRVSSAGGSSAPERSSGDSARTVVTELSGEEGNTAPGTPRGDTIDQVFVQTDIVQLDADESATNTLTVDAASAVPGEDLASTGIEDSTEDGIEESVSTSTSAPSTSPESSTTAPSTLAADGRLLVEADEFLRDRWGDPPLANPGDVGLLGNATGDPATDNAFGILSADIVGSTVVLQLAEGLGTMTLPLSTSSEWFVVSDAQTPFGAAFGTGFVSTDRQFYSYQLSTVDGRSLFLFGGTEASDVPADGNLRIYGVFPDATQGLTVPGIAQSLLRAEDGSDFDVSNASLTPLYVLEADEGLIGDIPDGAGSTVGMIAALEIQGSGSAQRSMLFSATMDFFINEDGKLQFSGPRRGGIRSAANEGPKNFTGFFGSTETDSGTRVFGDNANAMVIGNDPPNDIYFSGNYNDDVSNSTSNNTGSLHITRLLAETSSSGLSQTSSTLSGYASGLSERAPRRVPDGDSQNVIWRGTAPGNLGVDGTWQGNPDLGFYVRLDSEENRVSAELALEQTVAGDDSQLDALHIGMGTLPDPNNPGSQVFGPGSMISDQIWSTARNRFRGFAITDGGGELDYTSGPFTYLVPASLFPTDDFVSAVRQACVCDFLKWGFWGGQTRTEVAGETRWDWFHLEPWVAGNKAIDLPDTGVADYSGAAIADVLSNGNFYLANGTVDVTWDFAADSGSALMDIDSRTLSSDIAAPNEFDFAGDLRNGANLGDPVVGDMRGSFFDDPSAATGVGVAGDFQADIPAENWRATGIFMGQE